MSRRPPLVDVRSSYSVPVGSSAATAAGRKPLNVIQRPMASLPARDRQGQDPAAAGENWSKTPKSVRAGDQQERAPNQAERRDEAGDQARAVLSVPSRSALIAGQQARAHQDRTSCAARRGRRRRGQDAGSALAAEPGAGSPTASRLTTPTGPADASSSRLVTNPRASALALPLAPAGRARRPCRCRRARTGRRAAGPAARRPCCPSPGCSRSCRPGRIRMRAGSR